MLCAIVAVAGRQALFGNRLASFDEGQDAQEFDDVGGNYEDDYGEFGGFHGHLDQETDDFGTEFGDEEYHQHSQGYRSRPRRPVNSGPTIIGQGAPRRRKGGKILRVPDQDPRTEPLTQRNLNIMAKDKLGKQKKKTSASGRTAVTRSDTERDRLKAEVAEKDKAMAAKEKELQDAKRKLEDLQNQGKDDSNKKAKTEKHEVKPKKKNEGIWLELKNSFRTNSYPYVKFLTCEADEIEVMLRALRYTSQWEHLKDLSEEDQEAEAKSYVEVYGHKMSAEMNEIRTQHQSAIRTRWIKARKDDKAPSAAQLLRVARRNPVYLQILDEEGGTPEENEKNKAINQENEKYRLRFKDYVLTFVPTCIHNSAWNKDIMTEHVLCDYVDKDTGDDIVPAAVEAMVLLFVENNEKKWEWQAGVEEDHGGVKNFFAFLKKRGTPPTDDEKEPPTKYSSSKCGAERYGGWSKEGKKRFRELEKTINKGRGLETTKPTEEHFRKEFMADLEGENKKKKAKDKMGVDQDEEEEEEEDSEPGYESCDSEEEQEVLKRHSFLTKKQKEQLAKKQEEEKKVGEPQEPEGEGKENSGKAAGAGKHSSPDQQQHNNGRPTRRNAGRGQGGGS